MVGIILCCLLALEILASIVVRILERRKIKKGGQSHVS